MTGHIHEECGVFGIFAPSTQEVASTTYYALFALQHRGQESAGIVVNDDGVFKAYKDVGLVNDVFSAEVIKNLGTGNMAIGHVRYGTTGTSGRENAQPIVVNHLKGNMALAHNGNLVNSFELRAELENEGCIFHTTSDTEVISYIITKERVKTSSIEKAVLAAMGRLKGAYSLVVMSPSKLIAVRDPHGFRPLCYGVRDDGSYLIASESCALNAVGAKKVREVAPGEMLVFTKDGIQSYTDYCGQEKKFCVFEYFYIARPDSEIDGCYVHDARRRAGAFLAEKYKIDADIVIGVPDSGLDAALGYAERSGIPYGIGFIKNKYIGRTFIAPDQKMREDKVRIKLNVVESVIRSRNRMTYTEVTKILEGDAECRERYAHLVPMLEEGRALAEILINKREARGSVDLDVKEAKITLEDGQVFVEEYKRTVSHRMIEEFMILANETVASFMAAYEMPFVYRVHEKPSEEKAAGFKAYLAELGIKANFHPENVRPGEYGKILDALEKSGDPMRHVVNRVMLRSMSKARYSAENTGHFGLASDCYCHFTSPIRRYPDLLIHRIVKLVLEGRAGEAEKSFSGFVQTASLSCSETERRADDAERAVDELYKVWYMRSHIGETFEGIVSGVTAFCVFVELSNTVEGRIGMESLPPDDYVFVEQRYTLKGERRSFKIGDKLKVTVAACDIGSRKCNFVLAEEN